MPHISYKEACERIFENNRNDIILNEIDYVNWTCKCKFYDKIVSDYFFAIPKNVHRYNSAHPNRSKEKRAKTCIEKYGTDNPAKSESVSLKIKETTLKRYQVTNVMKCKTIKEKSTKTLLEKYNIDNAAKLSSNRIIKETGEYFVDWYKNQPVPKPAYSTLIHVFDNKELSLKDIDEYFTSYSENKSGPEVLFEKTFGIKHFNNKIPEHNINFRPDFKISDKIYVNVDGLYWHSEKVQTDKNYHYNLRKEFEDKGLRIFQFREDELTGKLEIVRSIINNSLGQTNNKIHARKCEIRTVENDLATAFLKQNHLMGSTIAKHIGLFYSNELSTLLSYKQKNNICKIERFCTKTNTIVVGGYTKLIKHLERNLLKPETEEIHNWVDLRYGTGKHLEEKGFKLIRDTLGWKWTDYINTYNRLKCRANMDNRNLSEKEHALELKWYKIYDAGQRLYVKKIK